MEYYIAQDEAFLKKEKHKARELRNSQWWKRKRSQGICHYCGGHFPPPIPDHGPHRSPGPGRTIGEKQCGSLL